MNNSATMERSVRRIETAITLVSASHFFLRQGQEVADVAAGGVFVATDDELTVGEQVVVELALHNYVLYFRGTVRFRTDSGAGVLFGDVSKPAKRVIEAFCERRRAPAIYDDHGELVSRH
ncbi:MAG TPA: PilZ domain-containing protein [Polyangiaceae bacterium]|jgi:Tfp pilus assembly protein PilZ